KQQQRDRAGEKQQVLSRISGQVLLRRGHREINGVHLIAIRLSQLLADRAQLCARLLDCDARLEPSDDRQVVRGSRRARRFDAARHPYFGLRRKIETGRHYAYDSAARAVYLKSSRAEIAPPAEQPLPETIADHHGRWSAVLHLFG